MARQTRCSSRSSEPPASAAVVLVVLGWGLAALGLGQAPVMLPAIPVDTSPSGDSYCGGIATERTVGSS